MGTESSARSKRLLESLEYYVWKTEVWNSFTHHRIDMWGFADHAAIRKDGSGKGTAYIQSTGEDVQSHLRKLFEGGVNYKGVPFGPNIYLLPILKQGNTAFLWAWRLRQDVGKRKTWQMKEYEFVIKDNVVICQPTGKTYD